MSTSKQQRRVGEFLSVHFGGYTIRENYKPDWLITEDGGRLELDFFIEELEIAIEVQGVQHFKFIEFFHHDPNGYEKRKLHDLYKQQVCEYRGVRLVEICDEGDMLRLLDMLPISPEEKFIPTDMSAYKNDYIETKRKSTSQWLHELSQNKYDGILKISFEKLSGLLSTRNDPGSIVDTLVILNRCYRKLSLGIIEIKKLELQYGIWIETVLPEPGKEDLDKETVRENLLRFVNSQLMQESE